MNLEPSHQNESKKEETVEDLIKKLNERGTKVKIVKEDEVSQSTPIQKQKKTDEAQPSVKKSTNSVRQ
jgi:DNA polymerase elongation subunit (family B)